MVEYRFVLRSGFHCCGENGITLFLNRQYWSSISCLLQPIARKVPVYDVPALYKKPELQRILHGIPVDLSVCLSLRRLSTGDNCGYPLQRHSRSLGEGRPAFSGRKAFATFCSTSSNHVSSFTGRHSGQKTMGTLVPDFTGLVGSFHDGLLFFCEYTIK